MTSAGPRITLQLDGGAVPVPHGRVPAGSITWVRSAPGPAGSDAWELVLGGASDPRTVPAVGVPGEDEATEALDDVQRGLEGTGPSGGPDAADGDLLRVVPIDWDHSDAFPEAVRAGQTAPAEARPRVRPGAYALLTRGAPATEVLLTRLSGRGGRGRWTMPGGGIDPGEDPAEAVRREVYEETGLTLEDLGLLGVHAQRYVARAPDGVLEDFVLFGVVYTGRVDARALPRVTEVAGSTEEAAWIPVGQLADLAVTPLVAEILGRWGPADWPSVVSTPRHRAVSGPA